jgi:hypothetical protein
MSSVHWRVRICVLVVISMTASCMPASRASRAPDSRQPVVVNLSPESIRLLSSQGGYAHARDSQTGMWLECRMAESSRRGDVTPSRAGLYRAIAGFVAGAVVTPALVALSPRVGSAWVDALASWQQTENQDNKPHALWCQRVSH